MKPTLDVRDVAHLARIDLSEDEITRFSSQLGRVLEYVNQLAKVDVSDVEPTAHTTEVFNVFRVDETRPSLTKSAALANAPHQANGLVMVTKVVE